MKQKLRKLTVTFAAVVGCWSSNAWAQDGNVWVAPQVPGVDVSTLDQTSKSTDDCVYTYNVGADAFLTYGMNWNTNAIATRLTDGDTNADLPHASWVLKDGEAIKIVNNGNTGSALGGDPKTANNFWIDQNHSIAYEAVEGSENEYYLSEEGTKIDVSWNYGGHLTGINGKGYTKWAFIPKEQITNGSYALYKAKKEMYAVYMAIPETDRTLYADALNAAYSAYTSPEATAQSVKDATKVLLAAVANSIETEVPANALFVHPDMLGEVGNISDWSTTSRTTSWSEFEVYHSAFVLEQTATVPNGLYKVVFHSLYRSDGNVAAPVLTVNNEYTANMPEMRTLDYGVNNGSSNGWTNSSGWIPNNMQSCGQALAHDGAVAVIDNIKVKDGKMTITVTEESSSNWVNFQGFDIYYLGAINMALYKQLQEKVNIATDLKDEPMSNTVQTLLNTTLEAATSLTANSDEVDLEKAITDLDGAIASAQASIAGNKVLKAGVIPTNTIDGWACTEGKFEVNTWSTEGNTDGSNMKTPFLQVWKAANTGSLADAKVTYTLKGIEQGLYKVSMLVRMLDESGQNEISGASLFVKEKEINVANGANCTNGIYGTYTIIGMVDEDETLTLGLDLQTPSFNWISFKDVTIVKLNEISESDVNELAGLVSEDLHVSEALKTEFNTKKDAAIQGVDEYNAFSECVHKMESAAVGYGRIKDALDDCDKKYQTLNATGDSNAAYLAIYEELVKGYEDGSVLVSDIDTKIASLNDALVAVVKGQTAANSDMTLAIVNPSFETGNIADGWTLSGTPGQRVDNGVKPNSNGTYTTAGCDGDYLLNVWETGLALSQTVTDLPNGVYELTVACANTGAVYKLMGKETEALEGTDAKQFFDRSCRFAVSDNKIALLLETVDNVWYKVDNFRLTYLGDKVDVDYTALEAAVTGYELGFAEGQYAPYNNTEAVKALNVAEKLLADKDAVEQSEIDKCVQNLTSANWTVNTEELNAVYDGNFALQDAHETSGGLVLAGWNNSNDGMRQLIKDISKYPGLADASAQAAVFTWPGAHSYGNEEGYAMPLQANTVYELSVKFAGWDGGGNNGFSVSVLNDDNEGLASVDLGKSNSGIDAANSLVEGKVRFVTGKAGNYILTVNANGNSTFTDINLFTAKPEDVNVVFKAEYGTLILPFSAEIPTGMKVYSVPSSTSNGKYNTLNLEEVAQIDANTPYVIQRESESNSNFTFSGIAYSDKADYTDGMLTGVVKDTQAPAGCYVLQNQEGVLGFYKVEEGSDINVTANHAYLTMDDAAAEVHAFIFDLTGDVTSVEGVAADDANVDVYSINGVLVRKGVKASEALNGLQKGLYIVNGVKKAVK